MTDDDLTRLFQRVCKESQRARYAQTTDHRQLFARVVVAEVRSKLQDMGFTVRRTRHKAHYDLFAGGLRIEVKASLWDGRRYQFNMRQSDADVLILACVCDGALFFFVLPFELVKGRTVIKVTQHDPRDYYGRFTPFYGAWDILPDLARSASKSYQTCLLQEKLS